MRDESKPDGVAMRVALARSAGNKAQTWIGDVQYIVEDLVGGHTFRFWALQNNDVATEGSGDGAKLLAWFHFRDVSTIAKIWYSL